MIDLVWLLLLVPLLVANIVFITEMAGGAVPPSPAPVQPLRAEPDWRRTAILIPAHDEEAGLPATLAALHEVVPTGMRTLVVADNCTDATAALARASGVEVCERNDPERRGKGFALAAGRRYLADDPPAVVIVVDADTIAAPGALALLAATALASARPVQGSYVIEPDAASTSTARFSAVAFFVKNAIRQVGTSRLGAPAILTGSGMAFPWPIFAALPLETGHVAEDLMLGVRCSLDGDPPVFVAEAWVTGGTSSDRGTAVQRRRWESGFVQVAKDHVPQLLARAVRARRPELVWLAMHLATPPLVLLVLADIVATALLALLALAGLASTAFWIMLVLTAATVAVVPIALAMRGRLAMLRDWSAIPRYLAWKLRLSVRTLFVRERSWVRTDRD